MLLITFNLPVGGPLDFDGQIHDKKIARLYRVYNRHNPLDFDDQIYDKNFMALACISSS